MLLNFICKNIRRGVVFKFKPATNHPKVFKTPVLSEVLIKSQLQSRRCGFHTTPPRNALPGVVLLLLRYVAKFGAVVSGRVLRIWWSKLTPEEQEKVFEKIRSKKSKIAFVGSIFVFGTLLYYIDHIVEDPLTKRRKFIMLNQKQMTQIGEFENYRQMQLFETYVIPKFHPIHRRVERVANTLILSNMDLEGVKNKIWSVTVIDKPEITNAFVLPHGKIFVFTGMLHVCTNDDQLAIVLAHEMAHCILSHVAESMSRIFLIDFLLLIPTILLWMLFPDMWAVFSQWITSNLTKVFLHLPFSRAIEKEADYVGMELAARSCYDVREAPVFWGKMKYVSKDVPLEWLSTHPSHESRQMDLKELVPKALLTREYNKCPPLRMKPFW